MKESRKCWPIKTSLQTNYIFFNATNISSLDLFRFGIQRNQHGEIHGVSSRPVFVLNRYFLQHNRESAEGRTLYHHAQKLRLADCVAASFAFPGGFEPLVFPNDFFRPRQESSDATGRHRRENPDETARLMEARAHFQNDLICDHKKYLALLDGGLYDNLGLASIEDIRSYLLSRRGTSADCKPSLSYVIATDVDQIPTQYSAYSEPEVEARLSQRGIARITAPIAFLASMAVVLLWHPPLPLGALAGLLVVVLLVVGLWRITLFRLPDDAKSPKGKLGLAATFNPRAALNSWWDVAFHAGWQLLLNPAAAWQAIHARRLGQLLPAFSGYLKRTRSLTYGYLQQVYRKDHLDEQQHCHLIRNMIFELTPGKESDPDYASKLITLPIRNYRHEEVLDPVSPIASKITRARLVSALLQQIQASPCPSPARDVALGGEKMGDIPFPQATPGPWEPGMLLLSLLTWDDGCLLDGAHQIIKDLNLLEADRIWRWLCNNLACFVDSNDSGCVPAHPTTISISVANLVAKLNKIFRQQIGDNHTLLGRCLVSVEETTSSYSWIPLICEMATNVPTTLWLKDQCWYTPNHYDNRQRIIRNGAWSLKPPTHGDPQSPGPIHCDELGPAPAAAVCTVAGYVSTCFNLLEFFYSWLGECPYAREALLHQLKRLPFPFATSESLHELAELPYALRQGVWRRLKQEERDGTLPPTLLPNLALLDYPLNRRNGLPESLWAGGDT